MDKNLTLKVDFLKTEIFVKIINIYIFVSLAVFLFPEKIFKKSGNL